MTINTADTAGAGPSDASVDSQKAHHLAGLVYLLYGLGLVFGITAIIGILINHTHIEKTRDTYAYSHFVWQILSFWVLFAGVAISILAWPGGFSSSISLFSFLWWMCTALVGSWFLLKNKPIPWL